MYIEIRGMADSFWLVFEVKANMLENRGSLVINRLANIVCATVYLGTVQFSRLPVHSPFKEDLLKSTRDIFSPVIIA